MARTFIANIQLLVIADSDGEAVDGISETLRGLCMEQDTQNLFLLDWAYGRLGTQFQTPTYYRDFDVETYEEGDFLNYASAAFNCPRCDLEYHDADNRTCIQDHGRCIDCHKEWQWEPHKLPDFDTDQENPVDCSKEAWAELYAQDPSLLDYDSGEP